MRPAVFVDRDGVVNELVTDAVSGLPESPLAGQDVVLVDGAAPALRRLRRAGYVLVGVSNQPAAAKGVVGLDDLEQVQARVSSSSRPRGSSRTRSSSASIIRRGSSRS